MGFLPPTNKVTENIIDNIYSNDIQEEMTVNY